MSAALTMPATSGRTPVPLVAGVDLATATEREADAVIHAVVRRLASLGGLVGATLGTHRAQTHGPAHVALSVDLPCGDDVDTTWRLLLEALPPGDATSRALCVGDRRTGPGALRAAADAAVTEHVTGSSGRAVHFPGVEGLVGIVSVHEVLTSSSIERVRVLPTGEADPDTMVVTRDFVRPRWTEGLLVLPVQPAVGATLVPFEVPNPTPCCADHR